ncbi:hypothetical protein OROMI_001034 [Orobanche minor]
MSIEFDEFLKEYGIVSQLTPPGTPQLNGVSERRNRILLDMVVLCLATPTYQFTREDERAIEIRGPKEPVIGQESPRSALRSERLEALGHHTVFIQDAVNALHKVGKALDKVNLSAAEEIRGVTSNLYNIANALQVLPQLIKVALSNIQQQKKEIMKKEQAKYTSFATRSAIALKASDTKLTGHDKNLDDLSLSLQTLADKFNRIKGKQDDVLDLVQSTNSHVSGIIARKGEEESLEAARRCILQTEAEIDAVFKESITAAINWLGASHQRYKVSGSRPEFQEPNVP